MKTEIQGDFKGYFLRFKMPSKKCFFMPIKSVGIIFLLELILLGGVFLIGIKTGTVILLMIQCLIAVGYYISVLYKDFWNIVLEESKGFWADIFMWIYYIIICAISLSPTFVLFYWCEMQF
jgi:hypothetical protein